MKPGDKLWYVPTARRYEDPREITVTKVGRKWATVEPSFIPRIDVATGYADSGVFSSRGRAYPSREAYETEKDLDSRWHELRVACINQTRRPDRTEIERIIGELRIIADALDPGYEWKSGDCVKAGEK